MSTPQAPRVDPSARTETVELDQIDEIDIDEIDAEEIEAQLSTGTPPAVLEEQLVEAFLR